MFQRFDSASAFLDAARDFLETQEAANSLILGVAQRVAQKGWDEAAPPLFALASDHGQPMFAAIMTPPYNLQFSQVERFAPEAIQVLLDSLCTGGWHVPGVMGPSVAVEDFVKRWTEATGARLRPGKNMRVHQLLSVHHIDSPSGRFRLAEERDLDVLTQWRISFLTEATPDDPENKEKAAEIVREQISERRLYIWENEGLVTMAAMTRPTRHGMSINSVYTPPQHRRHGYATSCVAKISRHILDSGKRFCFLYTDLANPTSNSIYAKIGYHPVCDVNEYHFY